MSGTVKGLTFEITADASGFEEALDRCTEKARALGDELERVAAICEAIPIARESRSGDSGR